MVTTNARKRIESIERDIIPSMFVGILSKDELWLKHTLEKTLPALQARALHLADECKKNGECKENDVMCDEDRIRALFEETRSKLMREHLTRERHSRFHH
ncbi:MAG: hypothetical protein J5U17_09095 [Candidatus Methanoperedens sp.]|nr:hypothetical protein [Candidatus Methanoperedens sp.]